MGKGLNRQVFPDICPVHLPDIKISYICLMPDFHFGSIPTNMRTSLLTLFVCLHFLHASSQDIIYKLNGDMIRGKITGINGDTILYTVKDTLQKIVLTHEVHMVRYGDGHEQVFNVGGRTTARSHPDAVEFSYRRRANFGLGLGMDYGGVIGVKLAAVIIPNLSVFGAVGYYIVGAGWSTGVTWHILKPARKRWIRPDVKIMFGTNGATYVQGSSSYNQLFYGFTPGAGAEIRFGKSKRNGFDLDLNVPIHGADFFSKLDKMKHDPNLTGVTTPSAVQVSFGYHYEF
jgi:hypothetical protein